jgi:NADPH2:quinone reductase
MAIDDPKSPLDLTLLKRKSVTFVWEFMFTRALFETEDMIEQHYVLSQIAAAVDKGMLKPTMTERLEPI